MIISAVQCKTLTNIIPSEISQLISANMKIAFALIRSHSNCMNSDSEQDIANKNVNFKSADLRPGHTELNCFRDRFSFRSDNMQKCPYCSEKYYAETYIKCPISDTNGLVTHSKINLGLEAMWNLTYEIIIN